MFFDVPVFLETDFNGQKLRLETGLLAKQATSSILATLGETSVMVNTVIGSPTTGDYFPLQVIYEEKLYASGKIKGSRFIKREGRPSDNAVLIGRMVDRSLRSLFDSHIRNDTQIIVTVLSMDEINPPDILAVIAASTALSIATKDFKGPVSSIRIGLKSDHIGQSWEQKISTSLAIENEFADLVPLLTQISESLNTAFEADKNHLRNIARLVSQKNPEWAKDFSSIYKQTPKLSSSEISQKYPTPIHTLVNPSYQDQEKSLVDLVVSGDGENIMMVEAGSKIVDEKMIGECLDKANYELVLLTNFQKEFIQKVEENNLLKNVKMNLVLPHQKFEHYWEPFLNELEVALYTPGTKEEKASALSKFTTPHFETIQKIKTLLKDSRFENPEELRIHLVSQATDPVHGENSPTLHEELNLGIAQNILNLLEEGHQAEEVKIELQEALDIVTKNLIQAKVLQEEKRIDGRKLDEVRPLLIQTDVLPRVHGSSLFQRGETQVLNILTLGTMRDAQTLDDMEDFEETTKRYIHHYNFPPYSVGETGRYTGPGRREIGHGALAEKALLPVLPNEEEFPYTMRLVSECLGSNGSTSMASTCASTLSLMAGGVPIRDMVAGVAMGLVIDSKTGNFKVLTDIQGPEDHYGDMDFKVTGTKDGITAIQLDNKVAGLTSDILKLALIEAKKSRLFILEAMKKVISKPKESISTYAPGVIILQIPPDKIGEIIGPSGKNIKALIQKYGVEIDIADDTGKTYIYSQDKLQSEMARDYILSVIKEYQPGEVVSAKVYRIEAYGAFVKIMAGESETGKEALIHISNMSDKRVGKVEDILHLNQVVTGQILEINDKGQISMTLNPIR